MIKQIQNLITVDEIIHATGEYFSMDPEKLRTPNQRKYEVTYARHLAQYLSRKLTYKTFQEIRDLFNQKNHVTAMYAHKKISERLAYDHAKTGRDVEQIEAIIAEYRKPRKR